MHPLPHEIDSIRKKSLTCTKCLLSGGCKQVVPSVGPAASRIMMIGEAPGQEEDLNGEPFVGASGKLLDKMLKTAGLKRDDIFITNVVRCRPPDNRPPDDEEITACKTWLWKEIKVVQPLVIVTMGKTAAKLLLNGKSTFAIGKVVGKPQKLAYLSEEQIIVPIFHPSYLLRGNLKEIEETVKILVKIKNYIKDK